MAKNLKDSVVRLGLVQAKAGDSQDANLEKTANFIGKAASKGAEIVCLQELFPARYFAQHEDKKYFKLAEEIPGKIASFLSGQAKSNKITLVGGSFYEKDNGKYYNATLIFGHDGKILGKYRKVHIPHDPKYYEQYYFSPGNLGFVQVQLPKLKIAPLICYDQWFPEAARANALAGAQLIFYPTAIGWSGDMKKYEPFSAKRWEDAMRAHASMNGVYVAAVNRVGKEDQLDFWGGSFIADPFGEVVARASSSKEEVLVADIDMDKIEASQEGWRFLHNRKPKQYGKLVE